MSSIKRRSVCLSLLLLLCALPMRSSSVSAASWSPVISDIRPYSFAVSWVTPASVRAHVSVQIDGRWVNVPDIRGNVRSTTHYAAIPCNVQEKGCTRLLKPNTSYTVRVGDDAHRTVTLHARTTPVLSPVVPLAAVGGHIQSSAHKPIKDGLVYVIIRHNGQQSVPLATLTISNGGWLVALANAVTSGGAVFNLKTGDTVSIRAVTDRGQATTSVTLRSVSTPTLLKKPLVIG